MNNSNRPTTQVKLITLCFVITLLQACSGGLPPSAPPATSVPVTIPTARATSVPVTIATVRATTVSATTATATAGTQGQLFADDFSNPLSGWDVRHDPEAITDYQNGEFMIFVGKINTSLWSIPNHFLTDVSVEADAHEVAGPDDNLYGLICRYKDANNFYRFVIAGNGYAGITKRAAGRPLVISGPLLTRSPAVTLGRATNHLKGICKGNQLSLYVNGQLVAQATDNDFPAGDVGLIASAGKHAGVEIHFTHFVVTQP